MYISCSSLCCTQKKYPRIIDAITKIRELGFTAFDLAAVEGWQNVDPSLLARECDIWHGEFAKVINNSGLKVSSLNTGLSIKLTDPDPKAMVQYEKEYKALLDLAARIGCPHITLQPGWQPKDGNVGPVFKQLEQNLERIAPINKDKNISVSVEPHHGAILEKPAEAERLVRAFWPAIGITYDPSHFCMQDIPLPDTAPLLKYTTHIHVRNASSGQMQDTMENGTVDFKWLISALKDHEYSGPVAIEYFRDFDPEFKSTIALKKLLEELLV